MTLSNQSLPRNADPRMTRGGGALKVSALGLTLFALVTSVSPAQIIRDITDGTTPPGVAPGAPVGSYALSGLDNVNNFNGNLSFPVPLHQITGRGEAGYGITLPIEHRWSIDEVIPCDGCQSIYAPHTAGQFTILPGYSPGVLHSRAGIEKEFCPPGSQHPGSPYIVSTLLRLTFIEPDGTEYELRYTLTNGQPAVRQPSFCYDDPEPPGTNRGTQFATRDGSTMTFLSDQALADPLDNLGVALSGYLMFKDGRRYRIDNDLVTKIVDRNGNRVSFQYDPLYYRVTAITDSLDRVVSVSYGDVGPPYEDVVTFQGFDPAPRTVRIVRDQLQNLLHSGYSLTPVTQLFPDLYMAGGGTEAHNPVLVKHVQIPDGRKYEFQYNHYGELAQALLPTGGSIEYIFGNPTNYPYPYSPTGDSGTKMVYRRIKERRVYNDGVLQGKSFFVEPEPGSPLPHVVSVRHEDPTGSVLASEKHFYRGTPTYAYGMLPWQYPGWREGREYQTQSLDTNQTTVLRTTTHTWAQRGPGNFSEIPPDATKPNDPRIIEKLTTLETGQSANETYAYSLDEFNNRVDTYEFDYGANYASRRTHADYETATGYTVANVHLRGLPRQESVYQVNPSTGAETLAASTQYTYDGDALQDRSGIVGHESGFGVGYATRGNLTRSSRWLNPGNTWLNTDRKFDIAGNVTETKNPRGFTTTFAYTDNCADGRQNTYAFATTITRPLGVTTQLQYNCNIGRPVQVTEANQPANVVTSYSYSDALDRPTQVVRAAGVTGVQSQTTFSYLDAARTIVTYGDLATYGDNALRSEVLYDGLGRQTETKTYVAGTFITVQQAYDAMGRTEKVSNPLEAPGTPVWTVTQYDALGRVVSVATPEGAQTTTTYAGNQTTACDPAPTCRKTVSDALGRVIQVNEDPPGLNYQTVYAYNALDNLTLVTQGAQTRTFSYASLGRLLTAINPESGSTQYSYDANGNLATRTDARNVVTTNVYDELDRVTGRAYSDSTPAVAYVYDDTQVPYSKGRLTRISSSVSVEDYLEYDPLGRVKQSRQTTDWHGFPFSYTYDLAGNLKTETSPSGRVLTYAYDSGGRAAGVSGQKPGETAKTYASSVSYAPHGAMKQMNLGSGLWEHWQFNVRQQPVEIGLGTSPTDSSEMRLAFSYCPGGAVQCATNNGNMLSQRIEPFGADQVYTYDALNRLTRATEPTWYQVYQYDRFGNMFVPEGYRPTECWTPNSLNDFDPATNRLVFDAGYDAAGNETVRCSTLLAYNAENRLVSYTALSGTFNFSYDGKGRLIIWGYGFPQKIHVYNAFDQLRAEYQLTDGQVPIQTRYPAVDHLGSTRAVDKAPCFGLCSPETERVDYLPFGDCWDITGPGTARYSSGLGYGIGGTYYDHLFTGKYNAVWYTPQIYDFGARHYWAEQGRFTSPDEPLADQQADDPQSWNLYSYVRNNPLRFTDPTGRACVVGPNGDYDDDSGGQSCADVRKENKNLKPSATVAGEPGNVVTALALNTFFALDNAANDYFRFLTDAMGVQPSYMQNTPANEGVTGNVASAAVFVGTAVNPRGLLTNARTRLLQSAQNPKLRNIIGNLYRPGATVGTGSTADAIRSELGTGILLSPKGHFLKGVESRTALQRLYRDPSLGASDRQIVKELLIDLQSSLSGR